MTMARAGLRSLAMSRLLLYQSYQRFFLAWGWLACQESWAWVC